MLLTLAKRGEHPAHLGAQGRVSTGSGEHLSALHPAAWQRMRDGLQVPEERGEPGALLFTAVALQLLPQPPKALRLMLEQLCCSGET